MQNMSGPLAAAGGTSEQVAIIPHRFKLTPTYSQKWSVYNMYIVRDHQDLMITAGPWGINPPVAISPKVILPELYLA